MPFFFCNISNNSKLNTCLISVRQVLKYYKMYRFTGEWVCCVTAQVPCYSCELKPCSGVALKLNLTDLFWGKKKGGKRIKRY